jgi:hypothetical protein
MSLSLLAAAALERLRARTPPRHPPAASPTPPHTPETPHQHRERLRQQALARGGTLAHIETIKGDCPAQTAQQIRDLTGWLEQRA